MPNLDRIIGMFGYLAFFLILIGLPILIGVAILSMLMVPLTYLFSVATERSYNSVIDSSDMLYKLNKLGQWTWLIVGSIVVLSFTFLFILK